ncbi:MAG: NHL repeat-containing protein [Pseudomonadota bacterium]
MKVSLAPSFEPIKAPGTAELGAPLLDPAGPECVLGWTEGEFATGLQPSSQTLFGPRGVCLHSNGSLWVSDTGHHRLLGWREPPIQDNQPADILIGQPSFENEGRNAKAAPTDFSLNVPTGIAEWRGGLAVADPWNHRVLMWRTPPSQSNQPADIILGQNERDGVLANRGADAPTASTLHWPYGVSAIGDRLVVCDTGNRRVLVWDELSETGQPADLVLGQESFTSRDENAGHEVSAMSMRWPHAAVLWDGRFAVADAGNNRVMLWSDGLPSDNGRACDGLIGQSSFAECDHNMANYYPSARALNMPYALAVGAGDLIVADTANSRLVGWAEAGQAPAARSLSGQPDFASKGDNGWGIARRDSLCWPYGLSARNGQVAIADSGNNRVLLWKLAP